MALKFIGLALKRAPVRVVWNVSIFSRWVTSIWLVRPAAATSGNLCVFDATFPVSHDDVIKWKHFPRNWPFVLGIHRSPVNSPHKGQWRWALMFSLICVWISGWVNICEAGDLRRYCAHNDVFVMCCALNSEMNRLIRETPIHISISWHTLFNSASLCKYIFEITATRNAPKLFWESHCNFNVESYYSQM